MASSNDNRETAQWVTPTQKDIDAVLSKLGVSANSWEIIDTDPETGLVMIHPPGRRRLGDTDNFPANAYTRGTVWAQVNGEAIMVSQSTGYMDSYTAKEVDISPYDPITGTIKVTLEGVSSFEPHPQVEPEVTRTSASFVFNPMTTPYFINPFVEGFLVRMARIRGKDYIMTHKKLDYSKSRWGNLSYAEVFTKLGLPAHSELFLSDVVTSPYTYAFMATYPGVITGTRQDISNDKGYITYVGATSSWNPFYVDRFAQTMPEANETGREYAGPWSISHRYDAPMRDYSDFTKPVTEILPVGAAPYVPPERLTHFLKWGFIKEPEEDELEGLVFDERATSGESLVITIGTHRVHVMSPSFSWRSEMRSHNPSILSQWNNIAQDKFTSWEDFDEKYIRLNGISMKYLRDSIFKEPLNEDYGNVYLFNTIPMSEADKKRYEEDVDAYRTLLFVNYVYSLPLNDQMVAIDFLDEYRESRKHLIDFFLAMWRKKLYLVDPDGLQAVGSITTIDPELPPPGRVYQKGKSNLVYDVTDAKVPKGKQLVLLHEIHPRASMILHKALRRASSNTKGKGKGKTSKKPVSDAHYTKIFLKSVNTLLDKEQGNSYYQIARQATAWKGN